MTKSMRRPVIHFPLPGQLPGASRKVTWLFGLAHSLCAMSLLYPYLGPLLHLVPLTLLLFIIRKKLPAEATVSYRFLAQRMLLLGVITLVCLFLLLQFNLHIWPVIYFTVLPLYVADAIHAFKGNVGLFYVRGTHGQA